MSAEEYARALGKTNAALIVFTLAWPFLLFGLYKLVSPSRDIPFGLIASMLVKPLVYLIYVLSVLAFTYRRLRDSSNGLLWLAVLAVSLLSSIVFWLAASAPWSVGFVLGAMGGIPNVTLSTYAGLLLLCLIASSDSRHKRQQGLVLSSPLAMFCSLAFAITALLHIAQQVALYRTVNFDLMRALAQTGFWINPISAILPIALLVLCYRLWRASGEPGNDAWAARACAAIALVVSINAFMSAGLTLLAIAVKVTQQQFSIWTGLGKATAILRVVELWGLMLLPLAVARLLSSEPQRTLCAPALA